MPSFSLLLKQFVRDRSDRLSNRSQDTTFHSRFRPIMIRRVALPPEPTFLGLPLELRQRIYEEMLELPARDHISLLCVCKRIFYEGKEHFYRRPLDCDSQDALDSFALSHAPETLQQIKTVNVRFQEVDPAMMQPSLALLVAGLPSAPNNILTSTKSKKLLEALLPCATSCNSPS